MSPIFPGARKLRFQRRRKDLVSRLILDGGYNLIMTRERQAEAKKLGIEMPTASPAAMAMQAVREDSAKLGPDGLKSMASVSGDEAAMPAFCLYLNEPDFASYLRTLPRAARPKVQALRDLLSEQSRAYEEAETAIEAAQDRMRALRAQWMDERQVPMSPGGLAEWVKGQSLDVRHMVVAKIVLEFPDPDGTIPQALDWILDQPDCDLATALEFTILPAISFGVLRTYPDYDVWDGFHRDYDLDHLKRLIDRTIDRVKAQDYAGPRFKVSEYTLKKRDSLKQWASELLPAFDKLEEGNNTSPFIIADDNTVIVPFESWMEQNQLHVEGDP